MSFKRIWWAIAFSLSVFACIIAIHSLWAKWHRRPVIVTFNDKTTSIGMIPFPAVSICSKEKFRKEKVDVDKFDDVLSEIERNQSAILSLSSKEYEQIIKEYAGFFFVPHSNLKFSFPNLNSSINQLDAIMHICFKEFINWSDELVVSRTESIYDTILDIGPEQASVVIFATWLDQITHFKPILTGEGICYTFNAVNSREIYSDELRARFKSISK